MKSYDQLRSQNEKVRQEIVENLDFLMGRVGRWLAPPAPHQTVHAVFPHTAFRCSSS